MPGSVGGGTFDVGVATRNCVRHWVCCRTALALLNLASDGLLGGALVIPAIAFGKFMRHFTTQ